MKKRLIICCVLVLALCFTAFVACKNNDNKLDDTALSAMITNLQRRYANASETTTESYKMPAISTYVNGEEVLQCDVKWTVGGTTLITVSEKDADNYVTINVPATRDSEIAYTLTATLVNEKGDAYKNDDGNEYSFTVNRKAPKTNLLDAANLAFNQTIVKAPAEGTAYKLATWKLQQQLYFAGETVSETTTYRYKTTGTYADSPDVYIENTDGGFYLYFMKGDVKTYIDLHALSATNGTTAFVTNKEDLTKNAGFGVFSVHETGALTTSTRLSENDAPILLYLGIRNKFPGQIGSMQGNYLSDKYDSLHTTEHAMYLVNAEAQMPAYNKELTEAQILEQAFALGANEEMYGRYTLEGKVTALGTYNSSFYTQTITIEVADKTIECYNMYIHNAGKSVKVNDKIRVTGTLANYTKEDGSETKVEFLAGAQFVITEVAPFPVVVSATNANVIELSKESGEVGETFTFKVEVNEGCTLTSVKVNGEVVTPDENGVYTGTFATNTTVTVLATDASGEDPKGTTAENPYTVAEAIALCSTPPTDAVYVKGIVNGEIKLTGFDPKDKWQFNLVDTDGDANAIVVYFAKALVAPEVGQEIVVKGWLTMFNGKTPEVAKSGNVDPIVVSVNGTDTGLDGGETPTPPTPPVEDDTTILGQIKTAAISAPTTEGSYVLVMWQGNLQKPLYVTGAMSGSYLATTPDITAAATVTVEEATGGFYLALTVDSVKKYVTVTPRSTDATKADISLADTATSVLTVNANGLLMSGDFVLGTYGTFNTVSVSNISYFSSTSVIDNTQYIVRIIPADTTINIPDGTIKEASTNENVTVTITDPAPVEGVATAKWYTTVTFTVTPDEGYVLVSVKVNGKTISAKSENIYEVELIDDMEIEVIVKAESSKEQVIKIDLSSDTGIGAKADASTEAKTVTIDGITFQYVDCYQNSGYLMLFAKNDSTARAYIANTTPINGKITKIVVTTTTGDYGSSTKAEWHIILSDTALTSLQKTGTAITGQGELTAVTATADDNYSFFNISVTNNYNGQIVSIEITYEPAEADAE